MSFAPITFNKTADGVITVVHDWPHQTQMTTQLLEDAPDVIRRIGQRVFFNVANGQASYQVIQEDEDRKILILGDLRSCSYRETLGDAR